MLSKESNKQELNKITSREGDGITFPKIGNKVRIHFHAFLQSGEKIESSKENDNPFEFQLGVDDIIKGLEIAIQKMSIGEKAKLEIPPHLAYGKEGLQGYLGANQPLIMEVELISITF